MATPILSEVIHNVDKLVLDIQSGFSGCEDKKLFVVYYLEQISSQVDGDNISYDVWNSEYFEHLSGAKAAFYIRLADDPIGPSLRRQFEFPGNSLADILENAMTRRAESA